MKKTIININRNISKLNKDQLCRVKTGGETWYGSAVDILGPSTMVFSCDKPSEWGSRVWIETCSEVFIHDKISYEGIQQKRLAKSVAQRKAAQLKQLKKQRRRRHWINYIKTHFGCVDCGYKEHPIAIHFDHVDRDKKTSTVAQMTTVPLKKLFAEMRKCELRCATCHSIKTHQGQEWDTVTGKKKGRPKLTVDKNTMDEIVQLHDSGLSLRKIADQLDMSHSSTRNLIIEAKAGVSPHD